MEEKDEGKKMDEILFIYYILACVIFNLVIKVIFCRLDANFLPSTNKDFLLKI